MPIGIALNPLTGQPYCDCCRLNLHHCKGCWTKHHNSANGKDFVPPEYFGEPFMSEDISKEVAKILKKEYEPKVKPDKTREYKEGDYLH